MYVKRCGSQVTGSSLGYGLGGMVAYEGCELHTLLVFSTFSHQIRAFGEEPAVSEIMSVPSISQV